MSYVPDERPVVTAAERRWAETLVDAGTGCGCHGFQVGAPKLYRAIAGKSDERLFRVIRRRIEEDKHDEMSHESSIRYPDLTDDEIRTLIRYLRLLQYDRRLERQPIRWSW